jgi:uridine phosphorylase
MVKERAVIEPEDFFPTADFPQRCVVTFFRKEVCSRHKKNLIRILREKYFIISNEPVYILEKKSVKIAVVILPVGAAAAAAVLEGLISGGCSKIIGCGYAGVLDPSIPKGALIIPDSAAACEGLTGNYFKARQITMAHPEALSAMSTSCQSREIYHRHGSVWTTDALFREMPQKIEEMRNRGIIAVDMETSALYAVAEFRDVVMGMMLYALDDVASGRWNRRITEKALITEGAAFDAAVDACCSL